MVMSLEEGDSDDVAASGRSNAAIKHSPFAFPFIVAFGISALILGSIQNFDCTTVTFPQLNTTTTTTTTTATSIGEQQGSFMSGPFRYKFVDVRYPVSSNNNKNGATNDETTKKIWEVCRGYRSTVNDIQEVGASSPDWTNKFRRDLAAVQGMAIVAAVLGSLTMMMVCSAPNCGVACVLQWKCYGFLLVVTCVFQGLSLLIFGSSVCLDNPILQLVGENQELFGELRDTFGDGCEIGVGARCGIASTVLWFAAGVLVCCGAPPGRYEENCLVPPLRAHQEGVTRRRRERAAALDEYERKKRYRTNRRIGPTV